LKAKKLIVGVDKYDKPLSMDSFRKWALFLESVWCLGKDGQAKDNVYKLLDFAGVRIVESQEDYYERFLGQRPI